MLEMPRRVKGKERADYIKQIAANRDHRSEADRRLLTLRGQSRADLEKDVANWWEGVGECQGTGWRSIKIHV